MAKFTLSPWSSTFPRLFPECWCHWQPPSLLNIPCPAAVSVLLLRNVSTRWQHFRIPHSNGAKGALMKPAFLSCHLECHVAEERPRASIPLTLPLWQTLISEKSLSLRWLSFLGEGFEKGNWNRDPHQGETWRPAGFSKLVQRRGLTIPGMH